MSSTKEPREIELTRRSEHREGKADSGVDAVRRPIRDWHAWCRPALIWLLAACVPGLIVGVASHFFSVAPLEKRLFEVQARQTAKDLDAVVQMRSTAVQIAASTRGSTNLVETKGLDRLLHALRGSFPDFLSMEILDRHGEILAMVGELPLSQAARSVGKSKTAKVGTMSYRGRDLFHDDPESDSFVLTVRHEDQDGNVWFTRTRFAREPIKQALASAREGIVATLMASPDGEADGFAKPATSWWADGSARTVKLETPGWVLQVKKGADPMFPWGTAIAAGLVAVLIGLAFVYQRFSPRSSVSWHASAQSSESMPRQRTTYSAATAEGSFDLEPERAPSAEPEDMWTPRNVPLGFGKPLEAEIIEICSPENMENVDCWLGEHEPGRAYAKSPSSDDEPLLVTAAESGQPEEPGMTVSSIPADTDSGKGGEREELGYVVADLPEVFDVVWFEPGDSDSRGIQSTEPDAAEAAEAQSFSCEDVPELLDVTWLEPDHISSRQQPYDAEEKAPSKTDTAVHPVT